MYAPYRKLIPDCISGRQVLTIVPLPMILYRKGMKMSK